MSKVPNTTKQSNKLLFVKSIYGKDKFDNDITVEYGNDVHVAWYVAGCPTLEDLEKKFTDEEILAIYSKQEEF